MSKQRRRMSTSSPSNSSEDRRQPSNASDGVKPRENALGKQVVELITRLANEAKPEDEKIIVEFTFTPMPNTAPVVFDDADVGNKHKVLGKKGLDEKSSKPLSLPSASQASSKPKKKSKHSRRKTSKSNERSSRKPHLKKSYSVLSFMDELSYPYFQNVVKGCLTSKKSSSDENQNYQSIDFAKANLSGSEPDMRTEGRSPLPKKDPQASSKDPKPSNRRSPVISPKIYESLSLKSFARRSSSKDSGSSKSSGEPDMRTEGRSSQPKKDSNTTSERDLPAISPKNCEPLPPKFFAECSPNRSSSKDTVSKDDGKKKAEHLYYY